MRKGRMRLVFRLINNDKFVMSGDLLLENLGNKNRTSKTRICEHFGDTSRPSIHWPRLASAADGNYPVSHLCTTKKCFLLLSLYHLHPSEMLIDSHFAIAEIPLRTSISVFVLVIFGCSELAGSTHKHRMRLCRFATRSVVNVHLKRTRCIPLEQTVSTEII